MLHHIQKSVINVLASTDPAHYADLKPSGMDGNQFTYHLKQVMASKLVKKNDDGTYSLTQKGRSYLVTRYEDPDEMAHTIFLVVIRYGGKLLLRERKVQPMLGYTGFVHGEPVASKTLRESVRERVALKTGIDIEDITVRGSGLIQIIKDGQPQSFSHAIIVQAVASSSDLPIVEDETGKNFWTPEDKLNSVVHLLPSCFDVLAFARDPAGGWLEQTYDA